MKHYICVEDIEFEDIESADGNTYMIAHAPQFDTMPTITESEICERFAEKLKEKIKHGTDTEENCCKICVEAQFEYIDETLAEMLEQKEMERE